MATRLTFPILIGSIDEAKQAHDLHHLNAQTLCLLFKITREQTRQIVKQCPACVTFLPTPHLGVNPRGLIPNEIWQMDVTHLPEFGKLKYIHVTIDTFSRFIFASLQAVKASKNVICHVFQCLSVMGLPKVIKTDNGPGTLAVISSISAITIKHVTGICYNPLGQGIVECAHQTLKNTIQKLKKENLYPIKNSPQNTLSHASFVLNFLMLDNNSQSVADRLWHQETHRGFTTVMWKDPLTSTWNGPDSVLI